MPADATIQTPTYRNLSQVARRFPPNRNDRPVHVATITRWITSGVLLSDGSRLKLDAKRLPGRWVVTDDAVTKFIDRLTTDRTGQPTPPPVSTSVARRRASERADRELDKIGF